MDEPQPQRPSVEPEPVPTAFSVATVRNGDGAALVVLQTQTPVGVAGSTGASAG